MRRPPPWGLIIQRASKQRRDKTEREWELLNEQDRDPRRDSRDNGRHDVARILPLIGDEE